MKHTSRRKRPTQGAKLTRQKKENSGGRKKEILIEMLFRKAFGRGMTANERRILVGKPEKAQRGRNRKKATRAMLTP